jgi:hypothetical protein
MFVALLFSNHINFNPTRFDAESVWLMLLKKIWKGQTFQIHESTLIRIPEGRQPGINSRMHAKNVALLLRW